MIVDDARSHRTVCQAVHLLWGSQHPDTAAGREGWLTEGQPSRVSVQASLFDSACLGHASGRVADALIVPDKEAEAVAEILRQATSLGLEHLFIRVDAGLLRFVQALEARGFYLVDTQVTLECLLPSGAAYPQTGPVAVREAGADDAGAILELGAEAFTHSRFWVDPRIGHEKATRLHARWIANNLDGRADRVFVALRGTEVCGFVACVVPPADAARGNAVAAIDLIAVHPSARGAGVGGALLQIVQWHYRNTAARLLVETQTHNASAIRLYTKNGFRWQRSSIALHWWGA